MSGQGRSFPLVKLPPQALDALGGGDGLEAMARLRPARRSRNLLLLRGLRERARAARPTGRAGQVLAYLEAGLDLLRAVQRHAPTVFDEVMDDPMTGAWLGCWVRDGPLAEVAAEAAPLAAAAAHLAGLRFRIAVPVRSGAVMLPGLGLALLPGAAGTAEVVGGGGRCRVDGPDGGSVLVPGAGEGRGPGEDRPDWHGLRRLRCVAEGRSWTFALDSLNPFRVGREPVAPRPVDAAEAARWAAELGAAWRLLVRRHPHRAAEVAQLVSSVVPLRGEAPAVDERGGWLSATFGDAVGLVALGRHPDTPSLAAGLVHEVQHSKLCALLDVAELLEFPPGTRCYSPWREDPRPPSALLQGAYAFMAVAGFWRTEAAAPAGPPGPAGPGSGPEAAPETGPEAARESGAAAPEAGREAPPEAAREPEPETAPEAGHEAAPGSGPEAPPEAPPEAGTAATEPEPETAPESGHEAPPEPGTAPPEISPETAPESGPEAPPEAARESGAAAPEAGREAAPEMEPESPPEDAREPAPGASPAASPKASSGISPETWFAQWYRQTRGVVAELDASDWPTEDGRRFLAAMRRTLDSWAGATPDPADMSRVVADAAEHRVRWRLRHLPPPRRAVELLAAARSAGAAAPPAASALLRAPGGLPPDRWELPAGAAPPGTARTAAELEARLRVPDAGGPDQWARLTSLALLLADHRAIALAAMPELVRAVHTALAHPVAGDARAGAPESGRPGPAGSPLDLAHWLRPLMAGYTAVPTG